MGIGVYSASPSYDAILHTTLHVVILGISAPTVPMPNGKGLGSFFFFFFFCILEIDMKSSPIHPFGATHTLCSLPCTQSNMSSLNYVMHPGSISLFWFQVV
jgi:hypothetical protein